MNGEKLARTVHLPFSHDTLIAVLPSAVSVPNNSIDQTKPLSGSIPETKYQRQRRERYEKKWALIRLIQEEHQKGKNIFALAREFQLYKLNKIITLHFHAEPVNGILPLLVYPNEEPMNRQIDFLDALIDNRLLQPFP